MPTTATDAHRHPQATLLFFNSFRTTCPIYRYHQQTSTSGNSCAAAVASFLFPPETRPFLSGSQIAGMLHAITILVCTWAVKECERIPDSFRDADQSCIQCGSQGIQLVPLQQEVCCFGFRYGILFHISYRWMLRCQIGFIQYRWLWTRSHSLQRRECSLVPLTLT